MKKTKCLGLLSLTLFGVVLAACGGGTTPHTHTYSSDWSHDETKHWHAATCEHTDLKDAEAEHTFVNNVCSVCGYTEDPTGKSISLTEITEPVNLTTEQQKYVNENYKIFGDNQKTLSEGQIYIGDEYGCNEYSHMKSVNLTWTSTFASKVTYTVKVGEASDLSDAYTYTTEATNVDVSNLKINTKYYWQVNVGEVKSAISNFDVADADIRTLNVEGITNVRDLGGKTNKYGKKTRQGLLYRGARFTTNYTGEEEITAKGKETLLEQIGLKTEIDLRKNLDVADYTTDIQEHEGMVENGGVSASVLGTSVNYVKAAIRDEKYILDATGTNNSDKVEIVSIKTIFDTITDTTKYPMYYHCRIGTDRTGGISYILGTLLGYTEDQLLEDYVYSMLGNLWTAEERVTKHDRCLSYMKSRGWWTTINASYGTTIEDKVVNALKKCGITYTQIEAFRNIMIENYEPLPEPEPEVEPEHDYYLTVAKNATVVANPGTYYYKWEKNSVVGTFNYEPYAINNQVVLDVSGYTASATPANDFVYIMIQPKDIAATTQVSVSFDLECNSKLQYRIPSVKTFTSVEAGTTSVTDTFTVKADTPYSLRFMFNDESLCAGSKLILKNLTFTPVTTEA